VLVEVIEQGSLFVLVSVRFLSLISVRVDIGAGKKKKSVRVDIGAGKRKKTSIQEPRFHRMLTINLAVDVSKRVV